MHNLSRFAQPAELQLSGWSGHTPLELLGRVPFPPIGEEPYTLTLGPYGYLWFDLVAEEHATGSGLWSTDGRDAPVAADRPPARAPQAGGV